MYVICWYFVGEIRDPLWNKSSVRSSKKPRGMAAEPSRTDTEHERWSAPCTTGSSQQDVRCSTKWSGRQFGEQLVSTFE